MFIVCIYELFVSRMLSPQSDNKEAIIFINKSYYYYNLYLNIGHFKSELTFQNQNKLFEYFKCKKASFTIKP